MQVAIEPCNQSPCVVNVEVVTVIRAPDPQAGEKSRQSMTVDVDNQVVVGHEQSTGATHVFGVGLPARGGDPEGDFTADGFSGGAEFGESSQLNLSLTGDVGSMIFPVNINYDLNISLDPSSGQARIFGTHNNYPSYEIHMNGVQVYDNQQQPGNQPPAPPVVQFVNLLGEGRPVSGSP